MNKDETEKVAFEDYVDESIREKMTLNFDNTMALTQRLKKEPKSPPLQSFEITDSWGMKKRGLERKILEFATILRERHGYTIDDERLAETIWSLEKAGFLGEKLTAYYFTTIQPIIISSRISYYSNNNDYYLIVAPKLLDEV